MLLINLFIKLILLSLRLLVWRQSINNNSNISISLPSEDAYICLQCSYISVDFEVFKQDDTSLLMVIR